MEKTSEQTVTPLMTEYDNQSSFDYNKLIDQFGAQPITPELISRFESVTGHVAHTWLRRGIFFAHRQLDSVLDHYEAGKPIFLYTGRGPSSEALHLGHMVPFMFTKWLQDVFKAILVIQISDDEKHYFKGEPFDKIYKQGFENAKDIIACGFDPERTFIFSNHDYSDQKCVKDIIFKMKNIKVKVINAIFGLDDTATLGQIEWALFQSAAAFPEFYEMILKNQDFMCLVPYAVDQDPYFRLSRDLATKYGFKKPCSIISEFLPALEGSGKMSSTNNTNQPRKTIFMTDDPKMVATTIMRHAFSGGKQTKEEHQRLGADLSIDVPYKYLRYFLDDDAELQRIGEEYGSGKMMTSEIKKILINLLTPIVIKHQEARSQVTQDVLNVFYSLGKFLK